MSNCAWVTLTTNDAYSLGALVLANSLKRVGTVHKLVVLVTPTVSEAMRSRLGEVFNLVQEVNVLDSQDTANLALLARPELGITFTKLHAWKLVQFEKCVFLDSDTLVLQNADELFEREELSAAPDVCWPDCFNSGVFVYRPSEATYASITEFALKNGSFDGGDQGLLNSYFSGWAHTDISKHLPFTYNTAAFATYSYLPAFKEFKNKIKILHFAGQMKPWLLNFNSETRTAYVPSHFHHASDLIQLWWNIYCDNVHQILSDKMFNQNLHSSYWPIEESPWSHSQNCNNPDLLYFPVVENYNSGDFFDDIQPYHDPWEDYYKNLENIKEQNFSNQNETFYEYKSPSPPPFHHNEHDHRQDTYSNDATENVPQTPVHDHQYEFHHSPSPQVEEDTFYECVETLQPTEMTFNDNLEQNSTKHEEIASSQWEEAHSDNCQTNDDNDTHRTNSKSDFNQLEHESQKSETKIFDKSPSPESESRDDKDLPVDTQKVLETKPSTSEAGLAGALAQVRLGEPRSSEQEAYEATMRRQCWEQGNIDYTGRDSFDNIWKKITQTLEAKPEPEAPAKPADETNGKHRKISTPDAELQETALMLLEPISVTIPTSGQLTSAEIEDGKVEYDPVTKSKTLYKHIEGGYEVHITTPQQNGTVKTQVKTFFDPKPCTEEDLLKQQQEKKKRTKKGSKEVVQIDKNTTMITREIPGGYEEVYTTVYDDGSKSMRTKTFYDAVEDVEVDENSTKVQQKKKNSKLTRTNTEEEEKNVKKSTNKQLVESNRNVRQDDDEEYNTNTSTTVEETRRVSKKTETSGKKTVRKSSIQEENVKSVTTSSKDKKKKSKKAPPPPADFPQNETTTVSSQNVHGGVEYTYSTTLEDGKTITTSKTIYEEEEVEMTEEEILIYKKQLKDAEKHKNLTTTKKLKSPSGTKKVVPSENPGEVTTVETIQIEGGTEYHYTTVTAEGIVKKAVKTVFDPVRPENAEESDEEEIIEEYEEEIIEPGEKIFKTIESTKTLPQRSEEIVEVKTPKKKSTKLSRTDTQEEESRIVQKTNNEMMAINQQQSNVRKMEQEEHTSMTGSFNVRRESKVEETRTMTQKIKISGKY